MLDFLQKQFVKIDRISKNDDDDMNQVTIQFSAGISETDYIGISHEQYDAIKKILIGEEQTIEIVVEGGVVQEVNNLPNNFVYKIKDLD